MKRGHASKEADLVGCAMTKRNLDVSFASIVSTRLITSGLN